MCSTDAKRVMSWLRIVSAIIVAAAPRPVLAQVDPATQSHFGVRPMYGGSIGQPLLLAGSIGLIAGRVSPGSSAHPPTAEGVFIQAAPGLGGGQVSLGIARSDNTFGLGAKGSIVRTWGRTWGTEPYATYAGGDVQLTGYTIRLSVGWLWKVGASRGKDNMLTWGVGLGF